MSKESIIAFSQAKAEPLWLQDLRQAAFDKLDGSGSSRKLSVLNSTVGI